MRIVNWIKKKLKLNHCVVCGTHGVDVAFKCDDGHVTCSICKSVGITECQYWAHGKEVFAPEKAKEIDVSLVEILQEQIRVLERDKTRETIEPSTPPRVEPTTTWQPHQPAYWTGTTTDASATSTWGYVTATANADSAVSYWG